MLSNFNNYAKTVGPEANLSLQAAPINICQDNSHKNSTFQYRKLAQYPEDISGLCMFTGVKHLPVIIKKQSSNSF